MIKKNTNIQYRIIAFYHIEINEDILVIIPIIIISFLFLYLEQLQTICQTTEIKKIKYSVNHCIYMNKRLNLNLNS